MREYRLRPYRPSDAQAVVDVINAASMRVLGFPRAVVDSVGHLWAFRFIPFSSEEVVATGEDHEIVGYGYFKSEEGQIVSETGASVHPDHWGRRIGTLLLEWAEERARESSWRAPEGIRTVLQTSLFGDETDAIKLFEDHGYSPVREWLHLVVELKEQPVVPVLAPHLVLREMDLENDWDIVGPAMDEAYADHWGAFPPGSYESYMAEKDNETDDEEDAPEDSSYSNAPGYCFTVLDGDTVAGGILCNAKLVERADTRRVGSLFVRPGYRRQGIARALMLAAFDACWKNGLRRVITDTDAKSFTEAPRLYRSLGMKPYRREFTYEKEIRPGREVRLLE